MTTPNVAVRISGEDTGVATLLRTLSKNLRDLEQLNGRNARSTAAVGASARTAATNLSAFDQAQRSALGSANQLIGRLTGLAAAYLGVQAAIAGIARGLNVNAELEQSALGIATIITAQGQLTDATGRTLAGTEALNAAQAISAAQLQQLRVAGLQTSASFLDLASAFQTAVGPGLAAGLNLDQVREITVSLTQAAGALGVPFNQLSQEVRSILEGQIDVNSRIAKTLGITSEQVKLERERGTLATFLNEKLAAFNVAGAKSAETFRAVASNAREALDTFAAQATQPLFERLTRDGNAALAGIFDLKAATVAPAFAGIVNLARTAFASLGDVLSVALRGAVDGAKSLSAFIEANRTAILDFARGAADAAVQIGRIVFEVGRAAAGLVSAVVQTGLLQGALRVVADVARLVADAFQVIADNKVAIGIVAITAGVVKLVSVIGGLTAIPTALGLGALAVAANPITAIAAVLTGLAIVISSVEAAARRARLEQFALSQQQTASARDADTLAGSYADQARQLADGKAKGDAARVAQEQLRLKQAELIKLAPEYRAAIQGAGADYAKQAEAVDLVRFALLKKQAVEATELAGQVSTLRKRRDELRAEAAGAAQGFTGPSVQGAENLAFGRQLAAPGRLADVQGELDAAEKALNDKIALLEAAGRAQAEAQAALTANKPGTGTANAGDARAKAKALADARLAEVRAELANIRALTESSLKDREQITEQANAAGRISLAEYFDRRAEIIRDGTNAEVRELEGQRAALQATPIIPDAQNPERTQAAEIARKREIAQIAQQILLRQQEGARQQSALSAEQLQQTNDLTRAIEEAEARVRAARGETLEDTQAAIRAEAEAYRQRLTARGDTDVELKVGVFIDTLTANAAFADLQARGQRALDDLARERQRIDTLAETGAISQANAQRQILAIEQARRPLLEGIARELGTAAAALGPEQQAQAASYANEIARIGTEATRAGLLAKNAFANIGDSIEQSLGNTLSRLGNDISTVGDAFTELARSVVQSIQRIVAELIAAQIVQGIANVLTLGSGGGGGGTTVGTSFRGISAATGGYIRGAGTGTSDSIPARLSNGEYVIRAAAVQRVGVSALDALNGMRTPIGRARPGGVARFAEGGLVSPGGGARGELSATIGLEEGLFVKGLSSRAGESAQLDTIRKHARTIRAILGT